MAAVLAQAARQTPEEQGVDNNIFVADLWVTRCDAVVVASRGRMYSTPFLQRLMILDLAG